MQYEYPAIQEDLKKSGLYGHNYWKEVQDFKWIKKEKSPNFTLVFDGKEKAPEEEQQPVFHNPINMVPSQITKIEESKPAVQPKLETIQEPRTIINSDKFELPITSYHNENQHQIDSKPEPEPTKTKVEPPKPTQAPVVANDDDDIDEL